MQGTAVSFPKLPAAAHAEAICPVVTSAVKDSGVSLSEIDAVAVTCTPGLIGSLLVGVSYAKALAFSLGVPLVPVNHIKAHVAAAYFPYPELEPARSPPSWHPEATPQFTASPGIPPLRRSAQAVTMPPEKHSTR